MTYEANAELDRVLGGEDGVSPIRFAEQSQGSEEIVLDCARCPYALEAHIEGQCPDEATAIAVWGRS